MALTDENGMVMPVAPMYGSGSGFGNGFGGDGWWIILLFIILGGAWGNNGFGGNGGGFGGLYPWMNQTETINGGFRDQMLNTNISGIKEAIANLDVSENSRQMANMNQMFALQSALQNCCCENRAGLADLKYTVATEACADRAAVNDALRDVIAANTASTQRILDQMCNDKIDAKNEKIADLERQLTMANLAASQNAQTSAILADNARQTVALEQYLNPTPVPAYQVANPNCCNNWSTGCGCGCGNF